jgi:hypothetical protein
MLLKNIELRCGERFKNFIMQLPGLVISLIRYSGVELSVGLWCDTIAKN